MNSESHVLEGRHALITGGGRGIGAAIAKKLNTLGAHVTLVGRSEEPLRKTAEQLQSAAYFCVDVTDGDAFSEMVKNAEDSFGAINILVNNAGAAMSAPFEHTTSEIWSQMLAVNLTSVYSCTHAVLPSMKKADWGRVINISSTAGAKGYAYVSAYCAAKHGVIGLTRSLALELATTAITVNSVCPGFAETDLLEDSIKNIMKKTGLDRESAEKKLKATNPQKRFIQPHEVAESVAWLCSPGSESVTGQSIIIAGGEIM